MPGDKTGRVIFIGNIPYGLTEEQVVHLFSSAGQVLNFRIVYDKDTGRPKGFGFAEFGNADEAASAVRNLNGHEIMGRTLRVDYSNEAGGGGDSNTTTNKHEAQTHQQAQHWQQMQQQQQALQAQGQGAAPPPHQPPPSIGVPLPDNVSAPDAISRTLSAMDPGQLLTVISQLRDMVNTDPQRATTILSQHPQLSYAVFQALLLLGLIDASVLNQVIETTNRSMPQPPQQAPMPYQPPPQQYPQQPPPHPPQFPPHFGQQPMMSTPPAHQGYPPPPMQQGPPKPPNVPDQQWDQIRQLCSIPQQSIDAMPNPQERNSIMALRSQYLSYFPQYQQPQHQPYMGIPGY